MLILTWTCSSHLSIFPIFSRKKDLTFHADYLSRRQFAEISVRFLGKIRKYFKMSFAEIFTQHAKHSLTLHLVDLIALIKNKLILDEA